ncbi:MAG: tape measure protein [Lachnospiraceae bacterium]|nr:tape measure protein [Lachnospiraceae bacterium]
MASIMTSIELQDRFSTVVYGMIQAADLNTAAIYNMREAVGTDIDTGALEGAKEQLDQAAMAARQLDAILGERDGLSEPVWIPVKWKTDDLPALAQTGIEQSQGQAGQTAQKGQEHANKWMKTVSDIAGKYINMQQIMNAIDISDQLASSKVKLDLMNDGMRTTEELQDLIFVAAERSRGSYLDMTNSIARFGTLAKDAFHSTEEVVAFSEQLNKQFIISGASTAEMRDITSQLTQALATGTLTGAELNSIFGKAPTVIQSVADYMNVPVERIGELASKGQITADVLKNAMFAAADETNSKFEGLPRTFEQIGQSIHNQVIMTFEPVFTKLNELANSEEFQQMANRLIQALGVVAGVTVHIFELLVSAAGFVADNWAALGPIIAGVAAELAIYYGWQMVVKAIEAVNYGLHLAMGAALMMKAAVMGVLNKETAKQIAAQLGLNAAMYACPVMWIIMLIVALIAVIATLIVHMNRFGDESTTAIQKVCGTFAVAAAFIGNLFISLVNFIIDDFALLWNYIALFANFLANVFTDPIGAAARLFVGFIDLALAGLEGLASGIDMLFGTNLAESVAGWRTELDGWVTDKFGKGEVVMEKMDARDYYIQGFDYEEAWNKGTKLGGQIEGISSIPDLNQYDDFDYSNYLSDILDSTEEIGNGLEVSEEDLKFMRDIAEQEAVNRFTTAAITIEQTNHNSVSGGMDLDGVITGLTDAVSEAADIITEGVH